MAGINSEFSNTLIRKVVHGLHQMQSYIDEELDTGKDNDLDARKMVNQYLLMVNFIVSLSVIN